MELGLQVGYAWGTDDGALVHERVGVRLHLLALLGPYLGLGPEVPLYLALGPEVALYAHAGSRIQIGKWKRIGGIEAMLRVRIGAEVPRRTADRGRPSSEPSGWTGRAAP